MDALKTAIDNYEHKMGLIKNRQPTGIDIIKKRLAHVINPLTGLEVTKVNFVKNIDLNNGMITINVDLESVHPFAGNIKEEIIERLQPLWDVKKVNVIFNDESPQ